MANGHAMEKQPAPTGKLAWIGFGWCVFSLASLSVAFCSPYWFQTWPKSENEFRNIGLWHVCFHNYMQFKDDSQEVYNGCWWLFDTQPRYYKLREWIIPPWFISCQVLTTGCLMVLIATTLVTGLIFLHICPIMNHEYLQTYGMFASGSMMFLVAMVTLVVGILFGYQVNDRYWLPRPDLNFLSWGFGFLVISGISALVAGICMFKAAWDTYKELLLREDMYTKQAMELSAFQMEGGMPTEQEFAVVQPGYSGVQPFAEEPYDQEPMRPPSYPEAPLYPRPPSYAPEPMARKPEMEPSYEPRASGYGYQPEPAEPLMYEDRQRDSGEFARGYEPDFGQSFEIERPAYVKSYDRSFERHYSDTSYNDPDQEVQMKPERQY